MLLDIDKFIKKYLNEPDVTDQDVIDYYTTLKAASEDIILDMIDRPIEASDYTEKYSGMGCDFLVLEHYPINSIDDITGYKTDDIKIQEDGVIVNTAEYFRLGDWNIEITYNAGYETIPDDIQDAVGKLGSALLDENKYRGDNKQNKASEYDRNGQIEYTESIVSDAVAKVVDNYKDDRRVEIEYVSI